MEPYVVAADVYAHPAHAGRGGWTWYTGSAGWMYRVGLESILGLRRRGATFEIAPCIPARVAGLLDRLALRRQPLRDRGREPRAPLPGGRAQAELDGGAVDPAAIPLVDDGAVHQVRIVIGKTSGQENGEVRALRRAEPRARGRGTRGRATKRLRPAGYQPRPDGSQDMVRVNSPRVRENTLRTGMT